MHVNTLYLKNYRNYDEYCVDFKNGLNLILGKNAVGKTNLLEAIYLLENGKSHRTSNHQELIKWDNDFSIVKASVQRLDRDLALEATISKEGGKQLKINGIKQKRAQGKVRPVYTIIFTPDHLKIVKETPEHRRSYIDEILEKVKVDYGYWRQQFAKILRQRNMLLKKVYIGRMKSDIIDYWDKQLIEAGVKLIVARKNIIEKLEGHAKQAYRDISNEETEFSLKYENQLLLEEEPVESLSVRYLEELKKKRKIEIERGQTLTGPHRDDMAIYVNGIDVRTFGSQGEQRSASLSLKLAELSIISDIVKESPILLLDDVMSELDEIRRKTLMNKIENGPQTIITSTNKEYFTESDLSSMNVVWIG